MDSKVDVYAIKGLPSPAGVKHLTKEIPYAPGMPLRYEVSHWFEKMRASGDPMLQKQWTLFVLGLAQFKSLPVDEKLSYFQIAGIHGYPETQWDNAPPPKQDPLVNPPPPGEQPFGGYCHHNTVAFPTWHRPYMLLFEQCIWDNMKTIIAGWKLEQSETDLWNLAADAWRLPYWDWARKQDYEYGPGERHSGFGLPYLFTLEVVPIDPPKGLSDRYHNPYPNPLWNFENPEKDSEKRPLPMGEMPKGKEQWNIKDDSTGDELLPWSKCSATSRYGILQDPQGIYTGFEGKNDYKQANLALADTAKEWYNPTKQWDKQKKRYVRNPEWDEGKYMPGDLADAVNRMFSPEYNGTWGTFSSTKWLREQEASIRTGYLSLEYIHNNIHNICGGDTAKRDENDPEKRVGLGHMCDVPVAAFDPIFWLHHCNIDRYVAMWQALNWNKWWDQPEPTDKNPEHTTNIRDFTSNDSLIPFHTEETTNPKTEFWTSDMARDWTKLRYSYDDLTPERNALNSDGTLNEEQYKEDLQKYIHATYPSTSYQAYEIRADESIPNDDFFGFSAESQQPFAEEQAWEDYLANVVYDRYALGGSSYAIKFYLGGQDRQADVMEHEENFVGQIYSLGGLAATPALEGGCANCGSQKDDKVLSKGQVALSIPIMRQAADPTYNEIRSIKYKEVADYLHDHLWWKFVQAGGRERPASDFPNTKISVWAGKGRAREVRPNVWLPPQYLTESYQPMWRATENKPCGLQREDDTIGVTAFADAPRQAAIAA